MEGCPHSFPAKMFSGQAFLVLTVAFMDGPGSCRSSLIGLWFITKFTLFILNLPYSSLSDKRPLVGLPSRLTLSSSVIHALPVGG